MTAVEQELKTCPLCGGDNRCGMANGQPAQACWCATATISATALAALPAESIGRRCICPACAQTKGDTPDER